MFATGTLRVLLLFAVAGPAVSAAASAPASDLLVATIDATSSLGMGPMANVTGDGGFFVMRAADHVPDDVVFRVEASEIDVRVMERRWSKIDLPTGTGIDQRGKATEIAAFTVQNGRMALHALSDHSSLYVQGLHAYSGIALGEITVLAPPDAARPDVNTIPYFDVSGEWEPFTRTTRETVLPVRAERVDQVSGTLTAATVYNGTLWVEVPGGSYVYDPYAEDSGPMAPGQIPLRWMELEPRDGTFNLTVAADRRDLIEATLFTSSLAGSGVRHVWVTAGDQTVSVDGDVFEARGSMLYAEGDFAAAIKAGEGSGSPGIHMDLYGDPDFIRMSDTFWQAPAGAAPAAVGLAALLAVAALVFRETLVRLAAPLGLLYTKLKKPQLLDHERRQALHDVIKQEPGVTFLQLHQRLKDLFARGGGYGFGSLTYHLSQLERFGLIVSKREGRFRRYFENGGRFGRDTVRIALLQTPPIPDLVAALLEDPGASQTHLHASLRGKHDVTRQTVGYHLKRLTEKDLVEVVRNGRSNAYHPTDKLRELGEYAVAKTASLKDLDSTPAAAG